MSEWLVDKIFMCILRADFAETSKFDQLLHWKQLILALPERMNTKELMSIIDLILKINFSGKTTQFCSITSHTGP